MDADGVFAVVQLVIYFILGGLALYFKYNARLKERAATVISEAESTYKDTVKAGGLKHAYVIDRLYAMIPVYLRPIITKAMVSDIVDNAFSSIEAYAVQQLNRVAGKALDRAEHENPIP